MPNGDMEAGEQTRAQPRLDTRLFWHALLAFAANVTLTWTAGAVVQSRHPLAGLLFNELLGFALPAAVVLYLHRTRADRTLFAAPKLKQAGLSFILGLTAVVVAVALGAAVRRGLGVPLPTGSGPGVVLLVGLAVVVPVCEELLFRPVLQRGLAAVWRPGTAMLATALLYALAHGSLGRFPETLVLGLFGGVVFLKTRSYWACVSFQAAAHLFAPALWGVAGRWPVLLHPLNAAFVAGVALFLAWHLERPRTERVWGLWKHLRWTLVGTASTTAPAARAPVVAALAYWGGVLLMVGMIWGLAVIETAASRLAEASRRVSQEDVWLLDARGWITARSRIGYARWPARGESVTYALPYTEAEVIGAQIAGQRVEVRRIGAGTFELVWPKRLPESPRIVEVMWRMPLEALEDADRGYRARLQALVPVTAYALTLVLDPGANHEFERTPERRQATLFSILDTGRAPGRSFGTTGIGLRRKTLPTTAE